MIDRCKWVTEGRQKMSRKKKELSEWVQIRVHNAPFFRSLACQCPYLFVNSITTIWLKLYSLRNQVTSFWTITWLPSRVCGDQDWGTWKSPNSASWLWSQKSWKRMKTQTRTQISPTTTYPTWVSWASWVKWAPSSMPRWELCHQPPA